MREELKLAGVGRQIVISLAAARNNDKSTNNPFVCSSPSLLPVDTEIPIIAPQSPSPPPPQRSQHHHHHHHSSSAAGASVAGLLGSVNPSQMNHGQLHHRQLLHGLLSGAHLNGNGNGPYHRNYSTSSTGQFELGDQFAPIKHVLPWRRQRPPTLVVAYGRTINEEIIRNPFLETLLRFFLPLSHPVHPRPHLRRNYAQVDNVLCRLLFYYCPPAAT